MLEPVVDTTRYRDVTRSPALSAEHLSATGAVRSEDIGLLVDIERLAQ